MNDDYDDLDTFISDLLPKAVPRTPPPLPVLKEVEGDATDVATFLVEMNPGRKPIAECSVPTYLVKAFDDKPFLPPGAPPEFWASLPMSYARQLLSKGPFSLADLENNPFEGEGVYALFYHGDLPCYELIRSPGGTCPIYIGKSSRTGRATGKGSSRDLAIHHRLGEHVQSIEQVDNLSLADFTYRFVVLPKGLAHLMVDAAEESLIRLFRPVWNWALRGFGARLFSLDNRGSQSYRNAWDSHHKGRVAAPKKLKPENSPEKVRERLQKSVPEARAYYDQVMLRLQGQEPENPLEDNDFEFESDDDYTKKDDDYTKKDD